MIIKKTMLFILVFFLIGQAQSQSMYGDLAKVDVKLKYVYSLDEALNLAKKEKKMIFFNCFADWATPCHSMNRMVFSNQEFADYMNKTFVNLVLDLSHKENIPIKDKYKVHSFAHYLVLDADGNVVHRISGGSPLPAFKDKVDRSLSPKTSLAGMEKEYAKGKHSVKFLSEYYKVVSDAGYSEIAEGVRDLYIDKVPKANLATLENWKMFTSLVEDIDSEWFLYFKNNKDLFVENNGEKKVKDFAAIMYMRAVMPFMSSTAGYTQDRMESILKDVMSFAIEPSHEFFIYHELASKRNRSSLAEYVKYLEPNISKIHPVYATGIDVSLKNIVNVTPEEQKVITDYLSRRMVGMTGSSLQQYQTAIKEIKNENGIIFEKGEFAEALKKAKAENKLIFLDAYTTWCGPCKVMAQQVFTLDVIGKHFNETFVNFKMDMESGEGPKWAKEFNVTAYPTFLLINGDGEMVHKVIGAHRPDEFVALINKGLVKETSYAYLKKEYKKGNREPLFILNYMEGMNATGDLLENETFLTKYYLELPNLQNHPEYVWPLVERFGADINNKSWNNIVNNKVAVNKLMGDSTFIRKVESLYGLILYNAIGKNEKGGDYEKAKKDLAQFDLPVNSMLHNLLEVDRMKDAADYGQIIDYYQDSVTVMTDPKGKTNMDLLWKYMITSLEPNQKKMVLDYLKKQYAAAGARNVNSYKGLLDALM